MHELLTEKKALKFMVQLHSGPRYIQTSSHIAIYAM